MNTDTKAGAASRQLQQTITKHGQNARLSNPSHPYRIAKAVKLSEFIAYRVFPNLSTPAK